MKTRFFRSAALLLATGSLSFAATLAAEESTSSVVTILSDYQVLVEKYDTNDDNLLNGEDVSNLPAALQEQLQQQLTSSFGLDESDSLTQQLATLQEQYGSAGSTENTLKTGISKKLDALRSQYATQAEAAAESADVSGTAGEESSSLLSGFESLKKTLGN